MAGTEKNKKQATRIFKKSTPNGKVTVYLGKRDFIDHLSHVDPIEGVVLVDPDYVKDRKVFISLVGAFKDCRLDFDSMGITFCQNLFQNVIQVYPPNSLAFGVKKTNENGLSEVATKLQSRLIRKLGPNAHPFYFELPAYSPASVTMMLTNFENAKSVKNRQQYLPCRVDYELRTYVADSKESAIQKRNSVKMTIRKLTYAPNTPGAQPRAEITKDFLMSQGNLKVEASLDKEKYFHGEDIVINLVVDNNSYKSIRKVKISVRQYSQLQIQNMPSYRCTVAEINSEEDLPIQPCRTGWCKIYRLRPTLTNNRDKFGIAMDGDLKHEDTNLASSTIHNPNLDPQQKMNSGIIVSYKVKIKLQAGVWAKDVSLELPFILTHPHPETIDPNNSDIDEIDMGHQNICNSQSQSKLNLHYQSILQEFSRPLQHNGGDHSLLDDEDVPINGISKNSLQIVQSNNPFLNDILVPQKLSSPQLKNINNNNIMSACSVNETLSGFDSKSSFDLLTDNNLDKNSMNISNPFRSITPLNHEIITAKQQDVTSPSKVAEKSMDDLIFDNFARNRLMSSH